jgi:hypothetical protein
MNGPVMGRRGGPSEVRISSRDFRISSRKPRSLPFAGQHLEIGESRLPDAGHGPPDQAGGVIEWDGVGERRWACAGGQ